MKKTLLLIFLLSGFQATAQLVKHNHVEPYVTINAVQYQSIPYLDPNKIDSLWITKPEKSAPYGTIHIRTKDTTKMCLLGISYFDALYRKNKLAPIIYMLDHEILKDASTFRIDSSFILKVEVIKGEDTDYLRTQFPDLIILNIITNTKANTDKQNTVRIRGSQQPYHRMITKS